MTTKGVSSEDVGWGRLKQNPFDGKNLGERITKVQLYEKKFFFFNTRVNVLKHRRYRIQEFTVPDDDLSKDARITETLRHENKKGKRQ